MKAIANLISDTIADQMRQLFRQCDGPLSFACALVLCSVVSISLSTSVAAQQKRPTRKSAAPSQPRKQTRSVPPPREAELQLERLPPDPTVEAADVSITGQVKARSLVFEVVPNPKVEFPGQPARDTVWEAVRENLPTPVEPGVTYRNIGIRLKITSVFRDIDRIVAEALGEVPITDDKSPGAETTTPSITSTATPPGTQSTSSRPPSKERP